MSPFLAVLKRDLLLALRRKSEVLTGLAFFVVVSSLFPLAIGPDFKVLRWIGPGVLWVGALLASMLLLNRLFEADERDGTLEQMRLAPGGLLPLVTAKLLVHWLVSGLPLVLISPILAIQFDLSAQASGVLMFSLLLGTPVLSVLGAIGAALTLGLRGGGLLLALLVLPLFVPVLVFGAGAVEAQASGLGAQAHLSILTAMLLASFVLGPWACSVALKIASE